MYPHDKNLKETRNIGTYFNLLKATDYKHIGKVTVNGEKVEGSSLKS
jgi:hypothetical protein